MGGMNVEQVKVIAPSKVELYGDMDKDPCPRGESRNMTN